MKSYEEMTENVLRRAEQEKKRKQKLIYTTAVSLACACLVAVMGFVAWKMSNTEPPVSLDGGGATENTPTNPVILQNPTEDIPTPTEPRPTGPVPTEPIPTDPQPTDPMPTDPDDDEQYMGGTSFCFAHGLNYHHFGDIAADLVGEDAYIKWGEGYDGGYYYDRDTTVCRYPKSGNIYDFIHDFNIPREKFEEIYYNKHYNNSVYNLDLLYGDDPQAVDEYYRNTVELRKTTDKRIELCTLKETIRHRNRERYAEVFGDENPREISIYDLATKLELSADNLVDIVDSFHYSYPQAYYYYSFWRIYSKGAEEQFEKLRQDPHPVQAMDAVICNKTNYEIE